METIQHIQQKLGRFKLKKERKRLQRNVKAFSIEKASKIGIIYDATNRETADVVKKFVQYFKEERKDVLSLGYINSKNSSDIVTAHLNYAYFDKRDLSNIMIPKGDEVKNFINKSLTVFNRFRLN